MEKTKMKTVGVFLARMQPVHKAHLFMVNKACEELKKCEKDFDKIYGTSYAKIKNKKYWKKELMKDD